MKYKKLLAAVLIIIMIFTPGCWDKVEIEKRAFIYFFAVDKSESGETQDESGKIKPFYEDEDKKIKTIFFVPIPSKVSAGGQGKPNAVMETTASSIPEAIRNLGMTENRQFFLGQTIVAALGEKLVSDKQLFKETLDYLERDPDINREMKVVVLKGKIDDVKNIQPELDKLPSFYIKGLLENEDVKSEVFSADLNEVCSTIRSNGDTVLPVIEIVGDKAKVNGLALIKGYKLLTMSDIKYVRPYTFITNNFQQGRKFVSYENHIIPFNITSFNRKIWLVGDNNKTLKYKLYFRIEGDLDQFYFTDKISNDKNFEEIKDIIEKSISLELKDTVDYFQKEVGHDFLDIGDYTNKYHNEIYKKYNDNWDEAFKNAQFEFEVDVRIRRIGTNR